MEKKEKNKFIYDQSGEEIVYQQLTASYESGFIDHPLQEREEESKEENNI
ncbi:hypothetical protein RZN25_13360 [Bacillaceae bacterium S4-13-56]